MVPSHGRSHDSQPRLLTQFPAIVPADLTNLVLQEISSSRKCGLFGMKSFAL